MINIAALEYVCEGYNSTLRVKRYDDESVLVVIDGHSVALDPKQAAELQDLFSQAFPRTVEIDSAELETLRDKADKYDQAVPMRLYKLKNLTCRDWDCKLDEIVAADTPGQARAIANLTAGDEGEIWENPGKVSCDEIASDCHIPIQGSVLINFLAR